MRVFATGLFVVVLSSAVGCNSAAPESGSQLASSSANTTSPILDMGEFCDALKGQSPADVAKNGAASTLSTISGAESGVVVTGGQRILKTLTIADCGRGSGVTIRLTEDQGGGLSGYEVFVRNDSTREVVGLAVAANGSELAVVPKELAFDKDSNKRGANPDGSVNELVHTRMGCFSCHSDVSLNYQIVGAEDFWRDARPVQTFAARVLPSDLPGAGQSSRPGDGSQEIGDNGENPNVRFINDPPL